MSSGEHAVAAMSAIYEGTLGHWRAEPARDFRHRVAMFYLDLDELPDLLGGRLVAAGPGLLRFRRQDYHGAERGELAHAVRATVEGATGHRPAGPVRVLTTLRTFGCCFNPVSFYYCFTPDGRQLEAVLAEVTNTPWRERHAYVLAGGRGAVDKALHVSPFFSMDHTYHCTIPAPGRELTAAIENHRHGAPVFKAELKLTRRPVTSANVRRMLLRHPSGALGTLMLIYGHAIAIRFAGVRALPHPGTKGRRS